MCVYVCMCVCVCRESHVQSIEAQVTDLQQNITHLQGERSELFTKVCRVTARVIK